MMCIGSSHLEGEKAPTSNYHRNGWPFPEHYLSGLGSKFNISISQHKTRGVGINLLQFHRPECKIQWSIQIYVDFWVTFSNQDQNISKS
jgi:hypothetical protein